MAISLDDATDALKTAAGKARGLVGQGMEAAGGAASTAADAVKRVGLRGAGGAAGALTALSEGANTLRDVNTPGMTGADQAARISEGVGRTAGAIAGAGLGSTLGPWGTAAGGVAGYFAPDMVSKAANALGFENQLPSDKAAGLRAPQRNLSSLVVPSANAAPAPKPAQPAQQIPFSGFIAPDTQPQINSANDKNNAQVRQMLLDRINDAHVAIGMHRNVNTVNGLNDAMAALAGFDSGSQKLGLEAERNRIEAGRVANEMARFGLDRQRMFAELGDKRMKDFNEQFLSNQFYTDKLNDKGVAVGKEPDAEKNARFADFVRQADPRFATPEGMAEITQLPAQTRSKLISELRQSFLEKEGTEGVTNQNQWFTKPGLSNAPIEVGTPRQSAAGDIPKIGLGNYLWSKLPFTNPDVVDTSSGTLLAKDFINEQGEGSAARRAKLYPQKGQ